MPNTLSGVRPVGRADGEFEAAKWAKIQMPESGKHEQAEAEHDMPSGRCVFHANPQQHRQAGEQQDKDCAPDQPEKPAQCERNERQAQWWRQELRRRGAQRKKHESDAPQPDNGAEHMQKLHQGGHRDLS